MRIIAGNWRGRRITAPPGEATRPTGDRTREALFSMLASRLGDFDGLTVADLFAGSGALGLEALSRGAASCIFVEQDAAAVDVLRANLVQLGAVGDVRPQSVMTLPPLTAAIDVVLMDPPYGSGAGAVALDRLARIGWIGDASWISIETARAEPIQVGGFEVDVARVVSRSRITLLRRADA